MRGQRRPFPHISLEGSEKQRTSLGGRGGGGGGGKKNGEREGRRQVRACASVGGKVTGDD